MKHNFNLVLILLSSIFCSNSKAQFNGSVFPGWTTGGGQFNGADNLFGIRLGAGGSYWNYRDKPLKWSGNLDLILYEKFTIGLGLMGENDYLVSLGTHLYKDEGFEIEGGFQRVEFSSFKAFSNNVYLNSKMEIQYPFYVMLESGYALKTNYILMDSKLSVSARVGFFIDLNRKYRGNFQF